MAKLYFRYGAMNCGKSTNLIQVAHNYEERGMRVVVAKPKIDTKDGDRVSSRLGIGRKVDFSVQPDADLLELMLSCQEKHGRIDCLLTDESQFFTEKQIDQLFMLAVQHDIPVICYGLRTDFMARGFDGSQRLLLIAHSIEELKTICSCGRKAILNCRKINGQFVFEGKQIVIDNQAEVQYIAMCGSCYLAQKEKVVNP